MVDLNQISSILLEQFFYKSLKLKIWVFFCQKGIVFQNIPNSYLVFLFLFRPGWHVCCKFRQFIFSRFLYSWRAVWRFRQQPCKNHSVHSENPKTDISLKFQTYFSHPITLLASFYSLWEKIKMQFGYYFAVIRHVKQTKYNTVGNVIYYTMTH